ncbi:MAG TPA: hypothetical protein VMT30_04620 [Candidatus Saccharimonadia bacterium]|nr:hypothetical protein [Candidatus Saccharimonadia bacterium]
MLKEIVVALAKCSHTLAGCTIAIDDQIELLELQDVAYRILKKKGFNAISQLVALDAVDLELALGRLVTGVTRALVQINRPPAPLNPDRPLGAVVEGEHLARLLTEAGVDITAAVGTFTASGLQAALSEHPRVSDPSAHEWVSHIRLLLDRCGYQLPD